MLASCGAVQTYGFPPHQTIAPQPDDALTAWFMPADRCTADGPVVGAEARDNIRRFDRHPAKCKRGWVFGWCWRF